MKPIIALSGKMLSGKSTVAQYLLYALTERKYNPKIIKLAQPLYDIQDYAYKRIHKTPSSKDRKLLQYLGTDWGRSINPNLWVDIWEMDVRHARMFENVGVVICDDVRFNNEAFRIKSLGGAIIRVDCNDDVRAARGNVENPGHASESGIWPDFILATIYNNGSVQDLHKNIDYLIDTLDKK